MIRSKHVLVTLLLAGVLTACAPANSMIVTVPPQDMEARPQASPSAGIEAGMAVLPSPTGSSLPLTETPLPPLEPPPPEAGALPMESWDGLPTYLADSAPDTYFRVNFNPHLWAKMEDQFGQTVLAHRDIPYCVITPITGRGMPAKFNTQRETRKVGAVEYEVNLVYQDDVLKFAAYYGGIPGELYTGFQVSFEEQSETCIQEAETVLASLRALPRSFATPDS